MWTTSSEQASAFASLRYQDYGFYFGTSCPILHCSFCPAKVPHQVQPLSLRQTDPRLAVSGIDAAIHLYLTTDPGALTPARRQNKAGTMQIVGKQINWLRFTGHRRNGTSTRAVSAP
jgi:hypothetical protein